MLHKLVLTFIGVLALLTPARATQSEDDYSREFRRGYDALIAGRYEEGIASMKRCLELRPEESVPAYNLACAYSLQNQLDPGFEWLERAIDKGFVFAAGANLGLIASDDKDLANLRADARFAKALERCKAQVAAVDAFAAKPLVYVPERLAEAEAVPLLVVLHDRGATKDTTFASGPWKQFADELGYALVLPSGKTPARFGAVIDCAAGMAWYPSAGEYETSYWKFEKPVDDAIKALRKERKLDPERVHIVGLGAAAPVAFNLAVSSPGLYKGVVTCDGLPNLRMLQTKLANARKLGLRGSMLFSAKPAASLAALADDQYGTLLGQLDGALRSTGLGVTLKRVAPPDESEAGGIATADLRGALEALAKPLAAK